MCRGSSAGFSRYAPCATSNWPAEAAAAARVKRRVTESGNRSSPRRLAAMASSNRPALYSAPARFACSASSDGAGLQGAIQKRFRCREVAARERDDGAHVQRLRVRGVPQQQARTQVVRLSKAANAMQLQRFLPHCRKLFARPARRHHRVVLPRRIVMGQRQLQPRARLRTSVRFVRHRRARAALPTEASQVGSRPRRACGARSPAISLTCSFRVAPGAHARADAPGTARGPADTRRTPRSSCLRGRAPARG